ncbi:MAG: LuxR C-terminal-related transcriptional regulator [Spirochaetaceae bacterium]|jgi:LuxR family maltose regulon positive regulatory protein|nr:LuxR C-terminal-related transcriptional regulator [Spirochaetaceae bacterium]
MTKPTFNSTRPVALPENRIFIERPRIDGILEQAFKCPVVSVVAGAGYGKTYAVYSYLQKIDAVVVWRQLSERDNMTWRFWENYIDIIAPISQRFSSGMAEIGFPESTLQFDRYISLVMNEVRNEHKYIVVLDDFHFIREPAIIDFLTQVITVPIANVSTIIISRHEPAINTVSLMSKGLLFGITAEDLRFSEEEIRCYLEQQNTLVSPEELTQIHRETEGWALAVNLIARDLRTREPDDGTYIRSLIKMRTFRNIEDEFFSTIQGELRKFLIKLSLIEYWPLDLLEKFAPQQNLIENLDNIGSFVHFDTYFNGYRIHHLFVEFLREKQQELNQEEIREIYTQAAQWCGKHNLRMDAAVYYERAEDYRGLIDIANSFPRITPNGVSTFLLEIVDRLSTRGDPNDGDFLFLRYIIRARLLLCLGRFDESVAAVREIIRIHEVLPPTPLSLRLLSAAYNHLGMLGMFTCRFSKNYNFIQYFERANEYYMQNPEPVAEPAIQVTLTSYILQIADPVEEGEIERALNACIPALSYAANVLNGYLYGVDSLARAELAYYQADMSNAERFARQAVFRGREKKQYAIENRGLFYLLRICLLTGSFRDIQELQKQLEAQLDIPEYQHSRTIYDIGMGRFYSQIGLTERIASWLQGNLKKGMDSRFHNFEVLVKARYLFCEKQYALALSVLENEENKRDLGSFLLGKLDMTILEAVTQYRFNEREKAIRTLEAAHRIACSNSLDMPFIEMGEDMCILAEAAMDDPSCTIQRSWLESIRNKASAYGKRTAVIAEQFRQERNPGVALSIREMEVLNALSQGLTREEIASDSAISINAVKSVISSLYTKLDAVNRADAIRIATNLGLLKDG